MLFAHGFGCDQNMWRYVAPAFAREHAVVLFDHVGSGGSDLSAYDFERYDSLEGYSSDVLEICHELELTRVVFVGHSVSAMIGVLAAIEEPERFDKLIMLAPSPRYVDDEDYLGGFSREDIDALLDSLDANHLGWSEEMAPVFVGNSDRPELSEELRDSFCRMNPAIARQFARVTFLSDSREHLPNVTTHSLVLQCSEDVVAAEQVGEYVHQQLPNSEFIQMHAAGHCPHLSDPDETIGAIRAFVTSAAVPETTVTRDGAVEENVEDLYENAPCAYVSTREDGTIVRVNETFLAWTGHRRNELVGRKRLHDLLPAGDQIYYETRYAPLLRMHGHAREMVMEVVRADGDRLPVFISSVVVGTPGERPLFIRSTIFDATQRRRYERELLRGRREAERLSSELESERRRLHRVLERMHEGVVTVDRDLRVLFANQAARQIPGFEDLDPSQLRPDAWPNQSMRDLAAGLFAEGATEVYADYRPTEHASYSILGIPAGMTDEAVIVFTDLSEVSRREQAERDFVANASHELRTPLTAISSAVEVLQSGAKEIAADRDAFLADIERETARLRRLTRALLLLAEIQAQKREPAVDELDLCLLLEDVAAGVQVRDVVSLEVNCDPGLKAISNEDLLSQALESVTANAAKYTVSGRISLSAFGRETGVTIRVEDTGPGVTPEVRSHMFDRFYRGRECGGDGFGLGLSIAREAIEHLGGVIEVHSSPEGGTIVQLRLPAPRWSARASASLSA
jgi:sigma-B regulation protein RsbQ